MKAPAVPKRAWAVALVLAALTAAAYAGVSANGFVYYDDHLYIYENPRVLAGLSPGNLLWALTTTKEGNWHPLTWLSHMLDVQLFGLDPRWHHLHGLLLHVLNGAGLFLVLRGFTGAFWRSALAAALFSLHPLHVQSVAWAAERKDVLSTFYMLLALGAYLAWVRRRTAGWYLAALGLFGLGLASKVMLVSLPALLLLLDYWPLGRWPAGTGSVERSGTAPVPFSRLMAEKVPFLALAAGDAALTWLIQLEGTAPLKDLPGVSRLNNALVALAAYIGKTLWPAGLSFFYPHPYRAGGLPPWKVAAAGIILVAVTLAAAAARRRAPYLAAGWLWYLTMLLPVIGLVQPGFQAMADRYTYMPLTGLFVAAAWGAGDLVRLRPRLLPWAAAAFVLALGALGARTAVEVRYWRDSLTLFRRGAEAVPGNWLAEHLTALVLSREGKPAEAESHYRRAIAYLPDYKEARFNYGVALLSLGRLDEAIGQFDIILENRPDADTWINLGTALFRLGKEGEAAGAYRKALSLEPGNALAHFNLGNLLLREGRDEEGLGHFREALRYRPDYAEVWNNWGIWLAGSGRAREAEGMFARALETRPDFPEARRNLERARSERP